MKRKLLYSLAFALISICLFILGASAQAGQGNIDWDNEVITATGFGAMPSNSLNIGQAKLLARRAAMVDAYRNLVEAINGVQVSAETTVKNYVTENDLVKSQISGFIQGAKIVNEQMNTDGTYMVVMSVDLYGNQNS